MYVLGGAADTLKLNSVASLANSHVINRKFCDIDFSLKKHANSQHNDALRLVP